MIFIVEYWYILTYSRPKPLLKYMNMTQEDEKEIYAEYQVGWIQGGKADPSIHLNIC
jgi:hypothetical protein